MCVYIYRRLLLGLLKSEFSASTTYPRSAPLRFDSLSPSLSRRVFPSLFHAVSSSFPSNVSAFRLLSSACLSMVATSEFESRQVEGLSQPGAGEGEKRTLSKCYPLSLSLPLSLLSFLLSLTFPCVSFPLPSPRISLFLLSSGGQRTGARRDRNHTHARCEPTRL